MPFIFNDPEQKNLRQQLRKQPTKPEQLFWGRIRNKQCAGVRFRRQVSIGKFVVDFFSFKKKLVIELDGDSHFEVGAKEYDSKRTAFLVTQGIKVLRFTNVEIMENLEGCLERLLEVIESTPPACLPDPRGPF